MDLYACYTPYTLSHSGLDMCAYTQDVDTALIREVTTYIMYWSLVHLSVTLVLGATK
jgi:hypothetical protein